MTSHRSRRLLAFVVAIFSMLALGLTVDSASAATVGGQQPMYRLYNPNSGEHFYTASNAESFRLQRFGWKYEGIGWVAPTSGRNVYRLYNRHAGDHHYTMSVAERNMLIAKGWKYEGVGWKSGGSVPVYRQYNRRAKKAGAHNYTTNKAENNMLVRAGWKAEGIGWYATAHDINTCAPVQGVYTSRAGRKVSVATNCTITENGKRYRQINVVTSGGAVMNHMNTKGVFEITLDPNANGWGGNVHVYSLYPRGVKAGFQGVREDVSRNRLVQHSGGPFYYDATNYGYFMQTAYFK
ncbi:hypothetical protein [Bifidobacterium simiarum]|nr:hypothetical protein [Bifidobacterium simiarum]